MIVLLLAMYLIVLLLAVYLTVLSRLIVLLLPTGLSRLNYDVEENSKVRRHIIERLNGRNYDAWKVKMQLVLEDLDLWLDEGKGMGHPKEDRKAGEKSCLTLTMKTYP